MSSCMELTRVLTGCMLSLLAIRETCSRRVATGVKLWEPTPHSPVSVHLVANYTKVIDGGLNKMLYVHAQVLDKGCALAVRNQRATNPPSYGVVLLPPFNSDISQRVKEYRINNKRQAFSDVFSLEALAKRLREKKNCFVSDSREFSRLVESGAVLLLPELEQATRQMLSLGSKPYIGSMHSQLYAMLELSARLRDQYYIPCREKLHQRFGGDEYLAVHLRIEDDWMAKFCWKWTPDVSATAHDKWQKGLLGKHDTANCFPPATVASITLSTADLRSYKHVLLLYAEDNLLRSKTARHPSFAVDPRSVWPKEVSAATLGDVCCFDENSSYTDRTAVSLMMAGQASAFAGIIQSRLTTGAVKLRTGRGERDSSYLYDCRSVGYRSAVRVKSIRKLITHC